MTNVQRGSTTSLEAAVGEAAAVTPKAGKTVSGMLEDRRDRITSALGKYMDADHFIETAVIQTQKEPKLLTCTPSSLMGAVMQAAQLRLEFGQLGLAYLVPRRIKQSLQAQFMVGYRGYIDLARRSGEVKDIVALPVYEKDAFRRWRDENGEHLLHEPHLGNDRGEIVRYYGHCILKGGGQVIQVMELSDIAARRAFSDSASSNFSPWNTNPEAMALKSCILKMKPWLPLTVSDAQGLAADEQIVEEQGERLVVRYVESSQTPELESQIPLADNHGEIIPPAPEVREVSQTSPPAFNTTEGTELDRVLDELDADLQADAEAYLYQTFGKDYATLPEAEVLESLDNWLNSDADHTGAIPAESHDVAPQSVPVAQEPLGEPEPAWEPSESREGAQSADRGVSDELFQDCKKKIDTWDAAICDRVLGEWGMNKAGALATKRLKLLTHLAPERAAGNPAATALF